MEIINHGNKYKEMNGHFYIMECPYCECRFIISSKELNEIEITESTFAHHYQEDHFKFIDCPECREQIITKKLKDFKKYVGLVPKEAIKVLSKFNDNLSGDDFPNNNEMSFDEKMQMYKTALLS